MSDAGPRFVALYAGCFLSGRHTSVGHVAGQVPFYKDRIKGPIAAAGTTQLVHIQILRRRSFLSPFLPFDEMLEDALLDPAERKSIENERDAHASASVVVFVVDPIRERFNAEMLGVLKRDLTLAGRDPASIPLVFQLNKQDLIARGEAPPIDRTGLTWPLCDYVESCALTGEGARRAIERAIELWVAR